MDSKSSLTPNKKVNVHFSSRVIVDGPGAATVFSGHEPLFDELYTLTNHYISGKSSALPSFAKTNEITLCHGLTADRRS